MITPARPHFFKYVNLDVAKKMLAGRKLRFSAPSAFNDPFDTQLELDLRFSNEELRRVVSSRMLEAINSPTPLPVKLNKPFLIGLEMIRQNKHSLRVSDEELIREFDKVLSEGAARMRSALPALWADFRDNLQNNVRILCVSEIHDDLLMWSHYADLHRGAVFQILCKPEIDNVLCAATPISYAKEMPELATLEEWVDEMFGLADFDYQKIWANLHSVKSDHWSYEKEWRVIIPVGSGESAFMDLDFTPEELGALYLGCRVPNEIQKEIVESIERDYPHIAVFQSYKNSRKFRLDFERIR